MIQDSYDHYMYAPEQETPAKQVPLNSYNFEYVSETGSIEHITIPGSSIKNAVDNLNKLHPTVVDFSVNACEDCGKPFCSCGDCHNTHCKSGRIDCQIF